MEKKKRFRKDRHTGDYVCVWVDSNIKKKVKDYLLKNNITISAFINYHFKTLIEKKGL